MNELIGKTIKLISSDPRSEKEDPTIKNYYNKVGIVQSVNKVNLPHYEHDSFHQIFVNWLDSNSSLMLIYESDKIEVLNL